MRKLSYLCAVSALLLPFTPVAFIPPARAAAPTTRPIAAATWPEAAARLARALVGRDITELATLLSGAERLSRFGSDTLDTPDRVLGSTTGMITLGVHAYTSRPQTLASDLASDFRDNQSVPESIRRDMIPPDDEAAKRADITAGEWITRVLKLEKEQPVGVVVLWPDLQRRGPDAPSAAPRPTFVLIKGQAMPDGFRITNLIYGDPLQGER
jgi:hypothetical protein